MSSVYSEIKEYLGEHYEFRYNEISNIIEYRQIKDSRGKAIKKVGPFIDVNENNLICEMQEIGISCSDKNLSHILGSSWVRYYNPFREYFENLPNYETRKKGDMYPDYIADLCDYVRVIEKPGDNNRNKERFARHLKKALVRCIACALDDGYINKHLIVFIGPQHCGKTGLCRWLVPPALQQYKAETIGNDKDSRISVTENFMMIMDELANLSKMELATFKTFISLDYIKDRLPFGKRAVRRKRTASFFANTNNEQFLTDVTGNVRWLSFQIDSIDWKGYTQNIKIDDIWAEAYWLYKNKQFRFDLSNEELLENEEFNERHFQVTTEMELIEKWFIPADKETAGAKEVDTTYIYEKISRESILKNINSKNVGSALIKLGFQKHSVRTERGPRWRIYVIEKEFDETTIPTNIQIKPEKTVLS